MRKGVLRVAWLYATSLPIYQTDLDLYFGSTNQNIYKYLVFVKQLTGSVLTFQDTLHN